MYLIQNKSLHKVNRAEVKMIAGIKRAQDEEGEDEYEMV